MGGAVSSGGDNDELIDNLLDANYIKSEIVERVFRAVDRANYILSDHKESAYKDLAWKHGHLHLSAPCIYTQVLEHLKLDEGMSFLNLGSGTGYFSTMVGLILGTYGVNHGVEIFTDVVDYARNRIEEFKTTFEAFSEFDFCEPHFAVGNCLKLANRCRRYDRVYCGCACPKEHEQYMRRLINVGGILVMPCDDHLLQIERLAEDDWTSKKIMPVSFATLLDDNDDDDADKETDLPVCPVLGLQEICRHVVRRTIRTIICREFPDVLHVRRRRRASRRRSTSVSVPRDIFGLIPIGIRGMMIGRIDDMDSGGTSTDEFDEDDDSNDGDGDGDSSCDENRHSDRLISVDLESSISSDDGSGGIPSLPPPPDVSGFALRREESVDNITGDTCELLSLKRAVKRGRQLPTADGGAEMRGDRSNKGDTGNVDIRNVENMRLQSTIEPISGQSYPDVATSDMVDDNGTKRRREEVGEETVMVEGSSMTPLPPISFVSDSAQSHDFIQSHVIDDSDMSSVNTSKSNMHSLGSTTDSAQSLMLKDLQTAPTSQQCHNSGSSSTDTSQTSGFVFSVEDATCFLEEFNDRNSSSTGVAGQQAETMKRPNSFSNEPSHSNVANGCSSTKTGETESDVDSSTEPRTKMCSKLGELMKARVERLPLPQAFRSYLLYYRA